LDWRLYNIYVNNIHKSSRGKSYKLT